MSSEFIVVVIIQPSNENAMLTQALNRSCDSFPEAAGAAKLDARVPSLSPDATPITPTSSSGTSLATVVETWSLPAAMGASEFRAKAPVR